MQPCRRYNDGLWCSHRECLFYHRTRLVVDTEKHTSGQILFDEAFWDLKYRFKEEALDEDMFSSLSELVSF